jgi:hypothetical protein
MRATDFVTVRGPAPAVAREEASWQLPVAHLSASSLTMAQRCPEQWRRRYVLGEKERPGAALVLGGAFHSTQEHNYGQKIGSHEDVPTEEMLDYFNDLAWPSAVQRNGGEEEIVWDAKPDTERAKGGAMVSVYREQVAPRIQPIAVEVEFKVDVGLPVPILGYVDVEREHALTELKTAKAKQSSPKPDWRLQGRIYQMVKSKPVEWHVITKTKAPAVYTPLEEPDLALEDSVLASGRTAQLAQQLGWLMNHYMTSLGPDTPWPGAITHPWACGFCGWRATCHWWDS